MLVERVWRLFYTEFHQKIHIGEVRFGRPEGEFGDTKNALCIFHHLAEDRLFNALLETVFLASNWFVEHALVNIQVVFIWCEKSDPNKFPIFLHEDDPISFLEITQAIVQFLLKIL